MAYTAREIIATDVTGLLIISNAPFNLFKTSRWTRFEARISGDAERGHACHTANIRLLTQNSRMSSFCYRVFNCLLFLPRLGQQAFFCFPRRRGRIVAARQKSPANIRPPQKVIRELSPVRGEVTPVSAVAPLALTAAELSLAFQRA